MNPAETHPTVPPTPEPPGMGIAPPTAPGRLSVPPREAQWPSFIGIISIIFGILGVAKSVLMLVYYSLIFGGVLKKPAEMIPSGTGQVNPFPALQNHIGILVTSELLTLGLGILLIVAGFGLYRKHPGAVAWTRIWAVLKIIVTIIGTAIGVWIQKETLRVMMNDPNAPPATPAFVQWLPMARAVVGGVASLVFTCAWPVFLLIWLRLTSVRTEVARWRSPA